MQSETGKLSGDAIRLKRAYEPPETADGQRVLVDRLWPRGISKQDAQLDAWMKELGPSSELRKWFGHRPERWAGFQERYRQELTTPQRQLFLGLLRSVARISTVTLVYGARDTQENEAVVLRDYLLAQTQLHPPTHDITLIVLAAIEAIAAAQASGEAPATHLTPFVGSLLATEQVTVALHELEGQGELQAGQGSWRISSRGKQHLQEAASVPTKPR